jgi:hypothetical protein
MKDPQKQIQDWQEHIRESFGDQARLFSYLFETMDNFYYRYLETTLSKDLKTSELAPRMYGALSFESNMMEALKSPNPQAKPGIIELAKSVPKAQNPMVRYGLWSEVMEMTADRGHLRITAEINWGFPEFTDKSKWLQKVVDFKYEDLAVFRKQLALRLEEACELFS